MKRTLRLMLTALFAATLAACSSGVKLDDDKGGAPIEARGAGAGQAGGADASGTGSRDVQQVQIGGGDASKEPWNDPNNPLSKRSIYFDFDSFAIKDEYRPVVETHARYLVANRGRKIVIQGNTDERGSREYNLALGQKRAEAVRRALAALGVTDKQMEAVSFGEERPRASGSDEAAFAENRRADIAYQ